MSRFDLLGSVIALLGSWSAVPMIGSVRYITRYVYSQRMYEEYVARLVQP